MKRAISAQYSWLQILNDANVTYLDIDFKNIFLGTSFIISTSVDTFCRADSTYSYFMLVFLAPAPDSIPMYLYHGLSKFSLKLRSNPEMLNKEIIIPLTPNTMAFDVLFFAHLEVVLEFRVLTNLYWYDRLLFLLIIQPLNCVCYFVENIFFSLDCQLSFIL